MKDIKKTVNKVLKCVAIIKFASTAITVGYKIYTLIPKSEKIKGIDTETLVENNMPGAKQ